MKVGIRNSHTRLSVCLFFTHSCARGARWCIGAGRGLFGLLSPISFFGLFSILVQGVCMFMIISVYD